MGFKGLGHFSIFCNIYFSTDTIVLRVCSVDSRKEVKANTVKANTLCLHVCVSACPFLRTLSRHSPPNLSIHCNET